MARWVRIESGVVVNAEEWDEAPTVAEGVTYLQSDTAHIGAAYDPATGSLTDPAPVVVVPKVVSRMQLKRALNKMGLLPSIESAIAGSGDEDLKIYWADTSEFHRDHPVLNAMLSTIGYTSDQADAVFTLAATLT